LDASADPAAFHKWEFIVIRIDHCSPIPLVIGFPTITLHDSAISKVARGSKSFRPSRIDSWRRPRDREPYGVHEFRLRLDRL